MSGTKLVAFEELNATWWTIYDATARYPDDAVRKYVTRRAFTELLGHVGWTVLEWNDALALRKAGGRRP